jgi:hypothetical protein
MPELKMQADAVNPVMRDMLLNRGLEEKDRLGDSRSVMGKRRLNHNLKAHGKSIIPSYEKQKIRHKFK